MKVLITGANGMVARAAIDYCRKIGDEVLGMTREELDISDRTAVLDAFGRSKFDAVLNCAAFTDVDGAETAREICYKANTFGVENLAIAAKQFNCGFVSVSTDYVFDGAKTDFYTQRDTPNPLKSVYSESKLEGEIRARTAYARSIIVRSGWIFGSGGTNFLSVAPELLAEGRKVRTIADAYGTPTFAGDLARRMRELAELDLPCIYHVANAGTGTSYSGFARKVCQIGGYDDGLVEQISHIELKRPAPRPVSSKLQCLFSERFGLAPLPNWEDALARFLEENNETATEGI